MTMRFKNTWASPSSRVDQHRADLFELTINLPRFLGADGGGNTWDNSIRWAVESLELPERARAAIPIKYLNQTNFQIGADEESDGIQLPVRFAVQTRTAEILERWYWLMGNPLNGGSALSSEAKTDGKVYLLVPSLGAMGNEGAREAAVFDRVEAWNLEGCWLKNCKQSGLDHKQKDGLVTLDLVVQIDRYYPTKPGNLTYTPNSAGVARRA